MNKEDQYFFDGIKNQDEQSIAALYQAFAPMITKMVLNNEGSLADAQDIFQEALIAILIKANDGQALKGSFQAYFYAICRNKWRDRLKTRNKEITQERVTNYPEDGHINEAVLENIQEKEIKYQLYTQHFAALSPHCQEILGLAITTNETTEKANSLKEVAEMLKRSYGYIRKEKVKCLESLKKKIQKDPRYRLLKNKVNEGRTN